MSRRPKHEELRATDYVRLGNFPGQLEVHDSAQRAERSEIVLTKLAKNEQILIEMRVDLLKNLDVIRYEVSTLPGGSRQDC